MTHGRDEFDCLTDGKSGRRENMGVAAGGVRNGQRSAVGVIDMGRARWAG